jgi:hypothetical protein
VVRAGTLYVANATEVVAFDATAVEGCSGSPPVCAPLWTAPVPVDGGFPVRPLAVDGGLVYANRVRSDGGVVHDIVAFDAGGETGCAGVPKVCVPIWATDPVIADAGLTGATVANGVVYATSAHSTSCDPETTWCQMRQHVFAWDAAGSAGCTGTPVQCPPLLDRTIEFEIFFGQVRVYEPVVANGTLYVMEANFAPRIVAFGLP